MTDHDQNAIDALCALNLTLAHSGIDPTLAERNPLHMCGIQARLILDAIRAGKVPGIEVMHADQALAQRTLNEQIRFLRAERDALRVAKNEFWAGFEEGKIEQKEMRDLAETYRTKAEAERDAALARVKEVEAQCREFRDNWNACANALELAESRQRQAEHSLSDSTTQRDAALAKLAAMQWIPCSERMPEPGQKVWVTCGEEVAIDSTFRSVVRDGVRLGLLPSDDQPCEILFDKFRNVTHWQPIIPPTPPSDRGAEVKP